MGGYRNGADHNDFSPPSTMQRRDRGTLPGRGGATNVIPGEDSSPPINLVRGYPLPTDLRGGGGSEHPSRHSTLRGGGGGGVSAMDEVINNIEYPTVRSGRSGRIAPPPGLGSLTADSNNAASPRSRPGTLERRRAAMMEEKDGEMVRDGDHHGIPLPQPVAATTPTASRSVDQRRRRDATDASLERRRRDEETFTLESQIRKEAEVAEERARERLYEPPIIQYGGREDGSGVSGGAGANNFFNGGNRNTLDRNLKSFSAPSRR